jgi:hypothetical protein
MIGMGAATAPVVSRAVILVEGVSDQRAVDALALRLGRDLRAEGVDVVPIGGSKNAGRFLERYGPHGLDVMLAGLYDDAQEGDFARGLEHAGLGSNLSRADMAALGFHVCVADLEDELIRALGGAAVEQVVAARGELDSFRIFQRQPEWRSRGVEEQLRRFLGTRATRKIETAPLLVDALDLARVPPPLERLLRHV